MCVLKRRHSPSRPSWRIRWSLLKHWGTEELIWTSGPKTAWLQSTKQLALKTNPRSRYTTELRYYSIKITRLILHLLLGLSSISFCCIYFSWHFPKIGHSIVSHFFSKWSGKAGTYPSENQLNRQAIFNTVYLMYVVCMFCNPVTKTWTCMILDSDSMFF